MGNGQTERFVWKEHFYTAGSTFAYNTIIHIMTGYTPFYRGPKGGQKARLDPYIQSDLHMTYSNLESLANIFFQRFILLVHVVECSHCEDCVPRF